MDPTLLRNIRAIFFDLDGTLLEVEMDRFIPAYLRGLSGHLAEEGGSPGEIARLLLSTTGELLRGGNGHDSNEEAFLAALQQRLGIDREAFARRLGDYCADGLTALAPLTRPIPLARPILQTCFERGLTVAVATNPVFPRPVVDARLRWGQLDDFPFRQVTTIENSRHCKPDPRYFADLMDALGVVPAECVMVGNDALQDLAARRVGIATFLVDTYLVPRSSRREPPADFRGGHEELLEFVARLGPAAVEN